MDFPLEEVYSRLCHVVTRTWRDMDAASTEVPKVMLVVKRQIQTVLALPVEEQPQSLDGLFNAILAVSFKTILAQQAKELEEKDYVNKDALPVRCVPFPC